MVLPCFQFVYMIRIPFFGPGELTQNQFRAARYRWSHERQLQYVCGESPTVLRSVAARILHESVHCLQVDQFEWMRSFKHVHVSAH